MDWEKYTCSSCGADFLYETHGTPKWMVDSDYYPLLVCFHSSNNGPYGGFVIDIERQEEIGYFDEEGLFDTKEEAAKEAVMQIEEQVDVLEEVRLRNIRIFAGLNDE